MILLVDMDAFFASCEQATDPRLKGKSVIVCGRGQSPAGTVPRTVVAACSYEAKALGVENGMSIPEALKLSPGAILVPGDPEKYIDIARGIFSWLERFTPLVEVVSIDEAFLDVTDTQDRFGSPEAIARQIQDYVEQTYRLCLTVGIGPNKLLAKLAAKLHKPHGIGRIMKEEVAQILESLPVESVSGIGPHITLKLHAMGIQTLGELAKTPVGELTLRFGFYGELLHRMALGIDDSPVLAADSPDIPKSMGHSYTLQRNTRDPLLIYGTLLRLAEKVARRLREEGLAARTISATVRWADFSMRSRQRTQGGYLNDGLSIYRIACRLLTEMEALREPVRLVGVSASDLSRPLGMSDLWEDRKRLDRLLAALDRINDLYGEETLTRAGALVPWVTKTRGYFNRRWYHIGGVTGSATLI